MKIKKVSFWVTSIICILSLTLVSLASLLRWYLFKSNCEDYLKLAGDAPTVEKANEFLGKAIQYMEENNLTSGNSALIFRTPTNDVGIWYNQIKAAKDTTDSLLKKIEKDPNSVSQLERDNALMKIREVVKEESGMITKPANIYWYPHQWVMAIWWILSIILLLITIIWFIIISNE